MTSPFQVIFSIEIQVLISIELESFCFVLLSRKISIWKNNRKEDTDSKDSNY